MNKGDDVGRSIQSESENWNTAQGYANLKILRHLVQLDRYDVIAQFGTEEMGDDMLLSDNMINRRRCEGIERLYSSLRILIENTKFAIRSKDKPIADDIYDRLRNVEDIVNKTYKNETDPVTHEENFEINEDTFRKLLELIRELKMNYNNLLNNAHLIFRSNDELDLDKIMSDIVEGG